MTYNGCIETCMRCIIWPWMNNEMYRWWCNIIKPSMHRRASTSNIGVAINFSLYSHHENLFSADLIYSFLIYCNEVNKKNDIFQKISFLVFFFAKKTLTNWSILISKSFSIFKRARPDNLSCPIVFLKYVFNLLNDEKLRSHSHELTSIVQRILNSSFIDDNAMRKL